MKYFKSVIFMVIGAILITGVAYYFSTLTGAQVISERSQKLEITVKEPPGIKELLAIAETNKQEYKLDDSPYLKPSAFTHINKKNEAYVTVFSYLASTDVVMLWNSFYYLKDMTKIRKVYLFLNSGGGDAFAGLAIADLIEKFVTKYHFEIIAEANGLVASAAVPVFVVASKRIAAPGTLFMVHEAALWHFQGMDKASDIRAKNELMVRLSDKYLGYLARHSGKTKDFWRSKEVATTWFTAQKAMKWGIVDSIE